MAARQNSGGAALDDIDVVDNETAIPQGNEKAPRVQAPGRASSEAENKEGQALERSFRRIEFWRNLAYFAVITLLVVPAVCASLRSVLPRTRVGTSSRCIAGTAALRSRAACTRWGAPFA